MTNEQCVQLRRIIEQLDNDGLNLTQARDRIFEVLDQMDGADLVRLVERATRCDHEWRAILL